MKGLPAVDKVYQRTLNGVQALDDQLGVNFRLLDVAK